MPTTQLLNLEQLQQTAVKYDPVLRTLPNLLLEPYIGAMHFNLIQVSSEDRIINLRRRGALLRPYKGTVNQMEEANALKAEESSLRVRPAYLALVDNVQNYKEGQHILKAGVAVDNKAKTHPYAFEVLQAAVATFVEDFTAAIPHAKYGAAGDGPLSVFDGYNAIIDALITSKAIDKPLGNLVDSAPMDAPADGADTKALTALVDWLRALHPMLKAGPLDVIIPQNALQAVLDAFENRRQHTGDTTREQLALYLRDKALLAEVPSLITSPVVGAGQRLIACRPGTISVGISAADDLQFVQVRAPYTDPNLVQFWLQADMGTRLDDWHAKVFATNGKGIQQTAGLSGDYEVKPKKP